MFGFIKKLFGGIFAFLGGLIGGKAKGEASDTPEVAPKAKIKKSKGYYLELDETGNTKLDVTALTPALAKSAVAVVEKLPEPIKAAVTAEAPTKAEAATVAKTAAPAPEKKLKKAKTKAPAAEAENGKVKIEAQPNPPAETNGKADQATFAPNYLMPTTTSSRRRPGPNMNTFLDMARQAKTPG